MYIAFKWLAGLSISMWIIMCGIDIILQKNEENRVTNNMNKVNKQFNNKNILTVQKDKSMICNNNSTIRYIEKNAGGLHYITFLAGAVAVVLFYRKKDILTYAKRQIVRLEINSLIEQLKIYFKKIFLISLCIHFTCSRFLINMKVIFRRFKNLIYIFNANNKDKMKFVLFKRIKEIGEERKSVNQLLIAAVQENKNLRTQWQLETMAKNRLLQHIENTQNTLKEKRSQYVSFQHLYLVTHQENVFLKSRIEKLTKDKKDLERNLMALVNEVYHSTNDDLKAYCSRLIVKTKDSLMNSDLNEQVKHFLENSNQGIVSTSREDKQNLEVKSIESWEKCSNTSNDQTSSLEKLIPLISEGPRLRGLPGECVWTVKDKNGLIEKLYEYDYESDFDNGDTIRRIREYSVYHDKDCLLDFSNSRTVFRQPGTMFQNAKTVTYTMTRQRFLTGSEAFKKFWENNKHIVPKLKSSTPIRLDGFV